MASTAFHDLASRQHLLGFDLTEIVPAWYTSKLIWFEAFSFSLSIMGILFAHEMGHFLTARYYKVKASLPYFIPSIPPLGTFGAIIRMETRKMPTRHLVRIAAFGPFAGIIVAIPVMFIGISLSEIRQIPEWMDTMTLGTPLLMKAMQAVYFPVIPEGHDVFLHPMAFAGWAGCLVTALNLMPIGQLDGGHIAYALLGKRFNKVVPGFFAILVMLGVFLSPSWIMLSALLYFFVGIEHPPMSTDGVAVGKDRWIAWAAVVVFILTMIPVPIQTGISLLSFLQKMF